MTTPTPPPLTEEEIAELERSIGSVFDDELTLSRAEAESLLASGRRCASLESRVAELTTIVKRYEPRLFELGESPGETI